MSRGTTGSGYGNSSTGSGYGTSGTGYGSGNTGTSGTGYGSGHTGTNDTGYGSNTHDNTGKKPSLLDRLNPMKDTDGDGKKGVME
ncbi:MAG: hypothetical protein M1830_000448 [Pleopsidium flavum]|nr:MAG: hypothetical protein M1830_000448 [Pleopsidium flavum]